MASAPRSELSLAIRARSMALFSYVVARDFGFAPNPFGGVCTLATCKPQIRKTANIGDWIAGLSAAADSAQLRVIYVMQVSETMSFDEYWDDARFQLKKPSRTSSLKRAFGDNIYSKGKKGNWNQMDSHHSLENGQPNPNNIAVDTQTDRVLIGDRFAYWGSLAPLVPMNLLASGGETLRVARGHRSKFSGKFVEEFVSWFEMQNAQGYIGQPYRWARKRAQWANSAGN